MPRRKPYVYIASPYSRGDQAINTHFQCKVFDALLKEGYVWPVAPLWSHFQHTLFPRPYKDWIAYDLALLPLYDACLRLDAAVPLVGYVQRDSSGADGEVAAFRQMGRPVFFSVSDLYAWVDGAWADIHELPGWKSRLSEVANGIEQGDRKSKGLEEGSHPPQPQIGTDTSGPTPWVI